MLPKPKKKFSYSQLEETGTGTSSSTGGEKEKKPRKYSDEQDEDIRTHIHKLEEKILSLQISHDTLEKKIKKYEDQKKIEEEWEIIGL